MSASLIERVAKKLGSGFYSGLTVEQQYALAFEWRAWARPDQLAPDWPWRVWLWLGGRGVGKTRTGAEWVREQVKRYPYVNLVGATSEDARVIMIEGESGVLAKCPDHEKPRYTKNELHWPNGAKSLIFTADEPERLRGKQHMKVWADEIAAWRYPESWDQIMLGLRLGDNPQVFASTTPRPTQLIRDLVKSPTTHVTRGTTYDNRANLAAAFFDEVIRKYEGTRMGRQELNAELLEDTPGALWTLDLIDKARVTAAPALLRAGVGLDPSGGRGERGIVAGGVAMCSCKGAPELHAFVTRDHSGVYTADTWGREAIGVYRTSQADRIIVERNYGGDMATALLRTVDPFVSVEEVTASRGKALRAEPVAALYEQGKVHHVGSFGALETQMTEWTPLEPGPSPDRLDALVWLLTWLMLSEPAARLGDGAIAGGARRAEEQAQGLDDDDDEGYGRR